MSSGLGFLLKDSNLASDNDYIEIKGLRIAKEINERGTYTAEFTDAAIPVKPKNDEERQKLIEKASKDVDEALTALKKRLDELGL